MATVGLARAPPTGPAARASLRRLGPGDGRRRGRLCRVAPLSCSRATSGRRLERAGEQPIAQGAIGTPLHRRPRRSPRRNRASRPGCRGRRGGNCRRLAGPTRIGRRQSGVPRKATHAALQGQVGLENRAGVRRFSGRVVQPDGKPAAARRSISRVRARRRPANLRRRAGARANSSSRFLPMRFSVRCGSGSWRSSRGLALPGSRRRT